MFLWLICATCVKIPLFIKALSTIVPTAFTCRLSLWRGKWGISEQGEYTFMHAWHSHNWKSLGWWHWKKKEQWCWEAWELISKGRRTEQLHLVHDADGKLWQPSGEPVYLISLPHYFFPYPPLCFLISPDPSIQGLFLSQFLSATCLKSSLCIFLSSFLP